MEILSPAGNMECLIAAVRSGADAVYLGLKDFSARKNAENFDSFTLKTAIEYCRIRGVKVYVAINTMIKEKELNSAVNAVFDAYNCGADAFIVSDLGLISVLNNVLPSAVLHASTQMTVHSPAALNTLKSYNIKRVVLAREMSREKIEGFCQRAKELGIEVEVFVHGALCMCVSGQCLLSSVLGGRSGNRGLCAGPCRLEFSAGEKGRYDLSLKDLSLIDYIKELESIGVASIKIEGRMKRPEYVAAATSACRSSLDGKGDTNLEKALKDVFSRSGFTDGYYTGKTGKNMFGIRTKDDVLSANNSFSYIHSLYRNERQSVPLNIFANVKYGEDITLTLKDNNGNSITVKGEKPEKAKSKCTTSDDIISALSKFGGTPYFADKIDIELDENLFVSTSLLNLLRRNATEKISIARAQVCLTKTDFDIPNINKHNKSKNHTDIYVKLQSESQIPDDLSFVDGIILPFECDFSNISSSVTKIADLPRYISNETQVQKRLIKLKSIGVNTAYCGNLSAIALANNLSFEIITSNGLNCSNSHCINALENSGAKKITLSAECYMPSAKDLSGYAQTGIIAYGRLPLMLTKNCPIKNVKNCNECKKQSELTDRLGKKFPVICREEYSEVFNSTPLYLADKKADLKCFDFIILNFTTETKYEVSDIIKRYIKGDIPKQSFTRGVYYKDIL